ncbi:hypothetical protein L204_106358 [Cryptococcus depauperatus]
MSYKAGSIYPCNPATARAESTKLGVDPKGEKLIYTNSRVVVIRDLNHVGLSHVYTQHTKTTTVARFSPSGYYAASADIAGNVRIWDVTQQENILKLDTRPLSGKINDIAWDGESKRIIVGGEGKDRFGAAFLVDSGSSCGEITGHSKPITALSIRHQRPFRALSGSDDNSLILHAAVPFKYDKTIRTHTRFVRDVAFSPNGDFSASVGSDGKLFFYEGKTGEVKGSTDRDGSIASLMALSWAPDSSKLGTAGADGVVAIWDASTFKPVQTYSVGSEVQSQQVGVVYANPNTLVSISLSGTLNIFDTRESNSTNWRTIHGPTKAITASAILSDEQSKNATFYAGSFDGTLKQFKVGESYGEKEGTCETVEGVGHSAKVVALSADGRDKVWSAGWDDQVASIQDARFSASSIPTKAQPTGIAATPKAVYIASASGVEVSGHNSFTLISTPTSAVAAHPGPNSDIVATASDKFVTIHSTSPQSTLAAFEDNRGEILTLALSPDGKYLASGDATGRIILIDLDAKKTVVSSKWTFHTGRVVALAWANNSKRLASAGLDENIYIWDVQKQMKNIAIKNAHSGGVSGIAWIDGNNKIISAGADGCVRTWTVSEL